MRYFKQIQGNYIVLISTKIGQTEITAAQYSELLDIIRNKPAAPDGFEYRLKTDLTWELTERPATEAEEITDAEALQIITGGAKT